MPGGALGGSGYPSQYQNSNPYGGGGAAPRGVPATSVPMPSYGGAVQVSQGTGGGYYPAPVAPSVAAAPASAGGAGGGSGMTATQALSSVATAAPNPGQAQALNDVKNTLGTRDSLLDENVQNVRNRMSSDTTGRAIQVASSGIDDSLAGAVQRAKEAAARSGTLGNIDPQKMASEETAQRAKAGAGANIALGREGQLDSLALGANAAYSNPSQRQLSLLGLEQGGANAIAGQQSTALGQALDAWRAQEQVNLTREAQAQQAAQASTAAALSLYNSLWR